MPGLRGMMAAVRSGNMLASPHLVIGMLSVRLSLTNKQAFPIHLSLYPPNSNYVCVSGKGVSRNGLTAIWGGQ